MKSRSQQEQEIVNKFIFSKGLSKKHQEYHTETYAITFKAQIEGSNSAGHTTLYSRLVDPKTGSTVKDFSTSVFPSSQNGVNHLHDTFKGFLPVPGFNTKGPHRDVVYEGGPFAQVHKIEGLDYHKMEEKNTNLTKALQKEEAFFALQYQGSPLRSLFGAMKEHKKIEKRTGVPAFLSSDPFGDSTMADPTDDEVSKPKLYNCTAATLDVLQAGGFDHKQSTTNKLLSKFSFGGNVPSRFKEDLELSGAKEVSDKELPNILLTAKKIGEVRKKELEPLYESAKKEQENEDRAERGRSAFGI